MKKTQRNALFAASLLAWVGMTNTSRAVDYHVATAQDLQNALTSSAADGADDYIYLAAGYYTGNFNFNSAENYSLTIQGEPGTTNTAITIDGAATGRDMNLANTGTGNFTVRGITFMRNCGNSSFAALRIAGGTGSALLADTCRFLSPTNLNAAGIGLDIVSGQTAIITNCLAIGKSNNGANGVQIQGVTGNITVGNCIISTNSGNGNGLYITGSATVAIVGNNFIWNGNVGCSLAGGSITLLNNSIIGNAPGVVVSGSSLTIAGNIIKNNVGGGGNAGGLTLNSSGSLILSNNIIAGNISGGALATANSGTVCGNSFIGNTGNYGLRAQRGSYMMISNNLFSANISPYSGGGIMADSGATVIGNTFLGNSSSANGGGLWCVGNASVISGNTFTGNSASSGGGLYTTFPGVSNMITANIFKQNSGGAVYASGSTLTMQDNLIFKNSGYGIYANPTTLLNLINNTVSDNTSDGLDCSISGVVEVLNVYNNIIWGNSGTDVYLAGTGSKKTFINNDVDGMYGVWDITANLIDVAPAFFDPVNGDYHLRSTSACINVGTNGAPSIPAYDLDGNNRTNAAIVDLGCYEFNNSNFHPADTNQNWQITAAEYANYATAWKNSQAWPTGPAQVPADFVTRAGYIQNVSTNYHNDGAGAPLGWKTGP